MMKAAAKDDGERGPQCGTAFDFGGGFGWIGRIHQRQFRFLADSFQILKAG
jgi:hypothetical protein